MTNPAEQFHALAETAVDDVLRLRPDVATWVGEHRYDAELPDLSAAGAGTVAATARRHLSALTNLDVDGLDVQDRVDAEILRNALEDMLFTAEQSRDHEWDVLAHDPGDALYLLMSRETTPLDQRVAGIAGRLGQLPDFLATARRTVVRAPQIHAETALRQLPGLRAVVTDELDRTLGDDTGLHGLVDAARERALAALDEHEAWLRRLAETADGDPRLGPELFRRKLPLLLDSPLSADDILARAYRNLDEQSARLQEEAAAYLADVGERPEGDAAGVVRQALDHVARAAPDDATVVAECERALAETLQEVRDRDLVSLPPDPMQVEVMPEFRRGVAVAYCDSPGALEEGGVTYVAISPTPADWPAERVASFYREYNSAALRNLMVHEAVPGHMVQLAHARRFDAATRVRKVFASGTFIEGWAVHAERLMVEGGFGGRPVKLQQLKMQLRMTINAILDAGVHAGGMTEVEALDLMMRRGFQEEGEAVGKWRRALLTSGQLSTYFVGFTELTDIVGEQPDRAHVDAVLAHGNPPPRHLATLLGA